MGGMLFVLQCLPRMFVTAAVLFFVHFEMLGCMRGLADLAVRYIEMLRLCRGKESATQKPVTNSLTTSTGRRHASAL